MTKTAEIIRKYRKANHLTQEEFASSLVKDLHGATLSRQSVNNWENGKHAPNVRFLLAIKNGYSDWRSEMATEILGVIAESLTVVSKGADGVLNHL